MFKSLLQTLDCPCSRLAQPYKDDPTGDAGVVLPLQIVVLLTGMLDLSLSAPVRLARQREAMRVTLSKANYYLEGRE